MSLTNTLNLVEWINSKECLGNLSLDGIISISSAVIALLIPIAIFLIENNGNSKDNSFEWDKMVIFSEVISARATLMALILITVPLMFWEFINSRIIIMGLYLIGIVLMGNFLANCYNWIISRRKKNENFRNIKRYKFLNKLDNDEAAQLDIWKVVWGAENQRHNMDETQLLEIYFKQYRNSKDEQQKISMLSIYEPNLEVTYDNYKTIKKFVYSEVERVFINAGDAYTKLQISTLFVNYSKQAINESNLRYFYLKDFDTFFKEASSENFGLVMQRLGTELINIIKDKAKKDETVNLNSYIPDQIIYDNQSDESKKEAIFKMYYRWLIQLPTQGSDKYSFNRYFANNLFNSMFLSMSAISFFTLNNFSLYLNRGLFPEDYNSQKKLLLDYVTRTDSIIGMGRVHSYSDEKRNKVAADKYFTNIEKEENINTYELLKKSEYAEHRFLKNKREIKKIIYAISRLINDKHLIGTKRNMINNKRIDVRLITLKETLEDYLSKSF